MKYTVLSTVLCVFVLFSGAKAQTNADLTAQQNQQLIQNYEQQQRFEEQQQRLETEKNTLKNELQYQSSNQQASGACIDIQTLEINGVTLLSDRFASDLQNEYEGRCLYLADMNAIMDRINEEYVEKGYISSRAYLPQQDLSKGTLVFQIIEGSLEDIRGETDDVFGEDGVRHQFASAFPNMIGKPLNIRDIEQGLDQMNRLRVNNTSMDLVPAQQAGGSILSVKNNRSKPWSIQTGIDNSGTQPTGVLQGSINASYDDLFGNNDYVSLSIKHDLGRTNRRQSKNVAFKYEFPYGYWTFSYGLNYFDYISELQTTSQNFKTSGLSRNHTFSASNVLHRDQVSKTTLTGSLVAKENENFFEGVQLDVSSRKLTIANLGLSHSRKINNGFLLGSVTYARGLELFGAFEDTPTSLDAQFDRFTFDANLIKQFDLGWGRSNPRLDLLGNAVFSSDSLFSSEQISIGGPFSVRGFKGNSISGDRGGYLRSDISMALPALGHQWFDQKIGALVPYMGFDIGAIRTDKDVATETGTLKSLSFGLKNTGSDNISFDFNYAKPLSAPSFIGKESEELFFRVTMTF